MKFRKSAHDAPPRIKIKPDVKPGTLPVNRIPVIVDGTRRGHVSARTGSAATALRFGAHQAKLGAHGGKPAWIGISGRGVINADAKSKFARQRIIAKGSVTKSPTKPALARRPERGG